MDFTEHDAKLLEGQTRRTLCAINFVEAALQALPRSLGEPASYFRILKSFAPAIKAIMQLQNAQLCQLVQLAAIIGSQSRETSQRRAYASYVMHER